MLRPEIGTPGYQRPTKDDANRRDSGQLVHRSTPTLQSGWNREAVQGSKEEPSGPQEERCSVISGGEIRIQPTQENQAKISP